MADINIYGTLKTMAEDQKVAYAKQVFDEDLNKDQHTINLELDEKIDNNFEELKEDVVRTGYLIASWEDDKILTSTTYAVGSIIGDFATNARYGGRGVRLNVKEGDKVLLDTYSPALYGLIFTDENRVIKALYDDRRFDGVWTAPCDGYCYIQDVLYRDCYHYASAHGHLAYMAHDARKRVAKGGDWYNEFSPRAMQELLPWTYNKVPVQSEFSGGALGRTAPFFSGVIRNQADYICSNVNDGEFFLFHFTIRDGADNEQEFTLTNYTTNALTRIYNNVWWIDESSKLRGAVYIMSGHHATYEHLNQIMLYWVTAGINTTDNLHYIIEKYYKHTSSDFGELYALAQKIINGEVEVDNFYGVKEKEVDLVKNAIGLQSISDLGYNILEHGATLPIDEEGYKYAKEIYDRYKDNPPTSAKEFQTQFRNDLNLVYFPHIDLSHMSGVATDLLISAFLNCYNLIACSELIFGDDAPANSNAFNGTFNGCYSLKAFKGVKMVNDNGISMYQCFTNCYSLEYVGILDLYVNSISLCFQNCYSLERIEEIRVKKLVGFNNTSFSNCKNLHFMLMKNIGHSTTVTTWYYAALTNWGIPNDKHPDARQSLVDSLLTYSYDRVNDPDNLGTADTTCTITLSANSYAQLTTAEIEAITAKGYTLTHP